MPIELPSWAPHGANGSNVGVIPVQYRCYTLVTTACPHAVLTPTIHLIFHLWPRGLLGAIDPLLRARHYNTLAFGCFVLSCFHCVNHCKYTARWLTIFQLASACIYLEWLTRRNTHVYNLGKFAQRSDLAVSVTFLISNSRVEFKCGTHRITKYNLIITK